MNKIWINILIVILVLVPFGLLIYFFGGFNKQSIQTPQACDPIETVYFGIVRSNNHISLSTEDNYPYISYGETGQYGLFSKSYDF